jgi:tRNA(Ile)-lysidine synthase
VNWDTFLDELHAWLAARKLLARESRWVVGVSGGPDSTLLLHALKALCDRDGLQWKLHTAHFHHGLRGAEADADAAFVAAVSEQLGIPYHTERGDVRGAVERGAGTTEEVARTQRYDFLEAVALRTGCEYVAVAHHADDHAETVLHRICRGTGLRGLVGIHDVRPIQPRSHVLLVRPLLELRRATIEELCAARGLETRTDSLNAAPEFTRGRIRHQILPLLAAQLNPQVVDALLRLSEQARLLGTYLEDAAARAFEALIVAQQPGYVALNNRALRAKPRIIQAEVVRRAVEIVLDRDQDVGFAHVELILRLAEEAGSGKEVHVPGPVVVRKQYGRLEFRPLGDVEPPPEMGTVFVACPGQTFLPALRQTLVVEVHDVDAEQIERLRHNANPSEEWLDYERIQPPLLVRGRHEGDRFHPLGAPGAKTIGDFFGEQKIDPEVRARSGILCDQAGPLWVMPLRIDERAKLRPTTRRALRLTLVPPGGDRAGTS